MHRLDELHDPVAYPRPGSRRETKLGALSLGFVRTVVCGEPRFFGRPWLIDEAERDAFRLHPQTEFHAQAMGLVGHAYELRREPLGIGCPTSEARRKVAFAVDA